MIAVVWIMIKSEDEVGLDLKKLTFYKKELKEILLIGIPAGIQSSFFSLSNTVLQSSVNFYGETAIAGNAAAGNIEGFSYVSMNAFYQSTLTGVGQNYGAKNEKRINKTILVNLICVTITGLLVGGTCVLFSRQLLGFYITDSAEALNYGARRMVLSCMPYFLCGIMEVLTGALRGLGYSAITAISSFFGACVFRVFWAKFIVVWLGGGIDILYLCWPISWLLVALLHTITLLMAKPRALKRMHLY